MLLAPRSVHWLLLLCHLSKWTMLLLGIVLPMGLSLHMCSVMIHHATQQVLTHLRPPAAATAADILDALVIEEVFSARCGHVSHTNGMFTLVPLQAMLHMQPCNNDTAIAAKLHDEQQRFNAIKEQYAELGRVFQVGMATAGGGTSGVQLLAKACVGCKPFPRQDCRQESYDPNADLSQAALQAGRVTEHSEL